MSYKTSRARRQLQLAYDDIKKRINTAEKKQVDPELREYVIAASIFLAFAEIENYIGDTFSAFATCVQSNTTKGTELPGNLRPHLFLQKSNAHSIFGNFMVSNSEKDLFRSFSTALNGHSGAFVDNSIALHAFSGRDIYTTIKYPSEKNLEKLFFRVGVDKVFAVLNKHLGEDAKALLASISSLRTQLAHTGVLPGVSCKDVKNRLISTERFVGAIDRVIYKVTTSHFGGAQWNAHLC
jgi:hypothetical protein